MHLLNFYKQKIKRGLFFKHKPRFFVVINLILEKKQIPDELFKTKLCEDFVLCVIYWFKNDCKESPEKIKDYYFAMNK